MWPRETGFTDTGQRGGPDSNEGTSTWQEIGSTTLVRLVLLSKDIPLGHLSSLSSVLSGWSLSVVAIYSDSPWLVRLDRGAQ